MFHAMLTCQPAVRMGPLHIRRFQRTELRDARLLFYGAGSSALGVADSITAFMRAKEGMSWEEARRCIYMVDSKGECRGSPCSLLCFAQTLRHWRYRAACCLRAAHLALARRVSSSRAPPTSRPHHHHARGRAGRAQEAICAG